MTTEKLCSKGIGQCQKLEGHTGFCDIGGPVPVNAPMNADRRTTTGWGNTNWAVTVDEKLDIGGMVASSGCHHRKGTEACGGCYLRLMAALQHIVETGCECRANASDDARDILDIIKTEGEGLKKKKET